MNTELYDTLDRLQQLIEQERQYAIGLNVSELQALQEKKGELLHELRKFQGDCPAELKEMAARLREKNRRNARLLHATLTFFRQTMSECLTSISPLSYGHQGQKVQLRNTGILHAGRI